VIIGILLGIIQGVTEWLPVSSEGVITALSWFLLEKSFTESLALALWLHVGTAISAIIAFRGTIWALLSECVQGIRRPSPLFLFIFVSTLISGAIGAALLILLTMAVPKSFGIAAMACVGLLMLVTAGLQFKMKGTAATRTRDSLSVKDSFIVGIAQGLAILPGLSRSGLTIAALLACKFKRKEALELSFLMSVPASLGAGLYTVLSGGTDVTAEAMVAMLIAAVTGLVTIRVLLSLANKINLALFVMGLGIIMILGALIEATSYLI